MITQDKGRSASNEADLERRLRALPLAPGPDACFRADLRTQLLAAVERGPAADDLGVDGRNAVRTPRSVRPRPRFAPDAGRRPSRLVLPFLHSGRRVLALLGAAMAVVLVITGTTYYLAQRALPGDALYGLKRAGETVDLSTKGGAVSRGSAYLSISSTRIDEAFDLVERQSSAAVPGVTPHRNGISAAGPLSPHMDELVHGVLADGASAAVTASSLLTTASADDRAVKPATTLSAWLGDQRLKVRDLVARLPETRPSTAGGAARALQHDLNIIQVRVKAIAASVGCTTCRFSHHDRFGPLPCRTCPLPPVTPSSPTKPHPTSTTTTTTGKPMTTAPSGTTIPSSTNVPTLPPDPLPGSGAGTTGFPPTAPPPPSTTTPPSAEPPTTTPPAPPSTEPTTPPDSSTSAPPTTEPAPPTTPPTTDDPTVPSLPTCLPVTCTDDPASVASQATAIPTAEPSS